MKGGQIIKNSRRISKFSGPCFFPVSHRKWSLEDSSQTPFTPSQWLHTPPKGMEPGVNRNWWWPKGQVSTSLFTGPLFVQQRRQPIRFQPVAEGYLAQGFLIIPIQRFLFGYHHCIWLTLKGSFITTTMWCVSLIQTWASWKNLETDINLVSALGVPVKCTVCLMVRLLLHQYIFLSS